MNRISGSLAAFGVAALGIALFAIMDSVMKGLSIALGAYNAMLWRSLLGTLIGGAVFLARRNRWPVWKVLRVHLIRGAVAGASATIFFWGLARVPLADGVALAFIAPLIALFLAAVLLGEHVPKSAVAGSLLGLSGVAVILLGGIDGHYSSAALWGMAAVLIAALLYAYNIILMRQQAQLADATEIAFFQNLTVAFNLALAAPFLAVLPEQHHWNAIAGAALLGFLSLFLLGWAYARAEANYLVNVEYSAFLWASLLGYAVFGEPLTMTTLAGAALIVAGCLLAAWQKPPVSGPVETVAL